MDKSEATISNLQYVQACFGKKMIRDATDQIRRPLCDDPQHPAIVRRRAVMTLHNLGMNMAQIGRRLGIRPQLVSNALYEIEFQRQSRERWENAKRLARTVPFGQNKFQ